MRVPEILTDPQLEAKALGHLRTYYDPAAGYTGRHFDTFAGGGERLGFADAITAEDLLALPMLAIPFSGEHVIQVLVSRRAEITALLSKIPAGTALWQEDAERYIAEPDSPGMDLWRLLSGIHDFGVVTVSKILARKRPHLFPIQDAVLKVALDVPTWAGSWQLWRQHLLTPQIRQSLTSWRTSIGRQELSLLRILDVVLWMEYRQEWRARQGSRGRR